VYEEAPDFPHLVTQLAAGLTLVVGAEVRVFLHTYNLTHANNNRSQEYNVKLDMVGRCRLNGCNPC